MSAESAVSDRGSQQRCLKLHIAAADITSFHRLNTALVGVCRLSHNVMGDGICGGARTGGVGLKLQWESVKRLSRTSKYFQALDGVGRPVVTAAHD
jgi:hypothetical protein